MLGAAALPTEPPTHPHDLHIQRHHRRAIAKRLHRDRREKGPATAPRQIPIIDKRRHIVLLRVAANGVVFVVAIQHLEVGLHHRRRNEAPAALLHTVPEKNRVVGSGGEVAGEEAAKRLHGAAALRWKAD